MAQTGWTNIAFDRVNKKNQNAGQLIANAVQGRQMTKAVVIVNSA